MISPTSSDDPSIWSPSGRSTRCSARPSWLKHGPSMRRDVLLLGEMIEAADQAQKLTDGITTSGLEADRQRRDALLWNFTVLGEAASRLSGEITGRFPDIPWKQPVRLRNRIVHGYWSVDLEILHTTAREQLPSSPPTCAGFSHPSAKASERIQGWLHAAWPARQGSRRLGPPVVVTSAVLRPPEGPNGDPRPNVLARRRPGGAGPVSGVRGRSGRRGLGGCRWRPLGGRACGRRCRRGCRRC
ncbi:MULTISPECIES: HepT-like ribonuclease domain-containing protein [unclassified Frankia]|uniref:HepT-like ribonuclease domain-containing protein n=1 Tax=unclassified Frankia TaxID=2632575 RepID=UPI0027DB4501|nr:MULTISPECIES: HepT-like ribonuclease domain-containing protein [unclassified Frankia]